MEQMGRRAVVIELDYPPASFGIPTTGDYLERCVASALFRPVLRLASASGEPDYFEFVVEDGHRFSDGVPVQPEHVLDTIVASATSAQWARYLGYLEKAQIVGDRLCLSMRRPARFFAEMLRTVDFAPTHPDGLGNGPYQVGDDFEAERGHYHLTPNPYVPQSEERPDLVFRLEADVRGAPDRFVRGETDITCSTAFPLDRLPEWRGSDDLHQAPTGIYMQVEPNPSGEGPLADPSLRRAMLCCLDLAAIAAKFPGGLRPVTPRESPHQKPAVTFSSQLRISYHDFYPNRAVLEHVALQWRERLGMEIELVERAYEDWREEDADASFVLRYLPFNHAHAYFDQCAMLIRDPAFDRLLERFAAGDEEARHIMNYHVQEGLPMLRMFEVIGNWLAGPQVTGFSWPADAVFDFTGLRRIDRYGR
jgi:peptide/nickel transport system substrate-binding protein